MGAWSTLGSPLPRSCMLALPTKRLSRMPLAPSWDSTRLAGQAELAFHASAVIVVPYRRQDPAVGHRVRKRDGRLLRLAAGNGHVRPGKLPHVGRPRGGAVGFAACKAVALREWWPRTPAGAVLLLGCSPSSSALLAIIWQRRGSRLRKRPGCDGHPGQRSRFVSRGATGVRSRRWRRMRWPCRRR